MIKVRCWKLDAYSQLIEEYAYKNRAKIVQKLLELRKAEEVKLGLNLPRNSSNLSQNPATCGLSLGADAHITSNNKGGQNCGGSSIH